MVWRAFDYTANPRTNPYVNPYTPKSGGDTATTAPKLIGAGVELDDSRHQANFMDLWNAGNSAAAYDYMSRSPSSISWGQRNQQWLLDTLFGGNQHAMNQWKNDASYGVRNAYSERPFLEDYVMNLAQGKSIVGSPWQGGTPVSQWRPAWNNPYGNNHEATFGSPWLGMKPTTTDMVAAGKVPVGGSVAAPPPFSNTSPATTTPTSAPNPYNAPNTTGVRRPANSLHKAGDGGWNPYQGWHQ